MLKILGRVTSINVRKVLWGAGELSLSYEREDWGMPIRDPKVPEFLALNPNGQVPVLIDDGFVLWESGAILTYLAGRDGRAMLLPEDGQLRGLVMQWLFWQGTELNPHWVYPLNALVRKTPGFEDPARIATAIGRWSKAMEILEAELDKGQPFITGAQFTLADIVLALSVHRWFMTPFEKKALPAVSDYYERMKQREAGKPWIGEATP